MRGSGDRSTPVWVPNPVDGIVLFLLEALIVLALLLVSVAIAALALWLI